MFSVNQATGALTNVPGSPFDATPPDVGINVIPWSLAFQSKRERPRGRELVVSASPEPIRCPVNLLGQPDDRRADPGELSPLGSTGGTQSRSVRAEGC